MQKRMDQASTWDHWHSFLAVAEAGSLSAAARARGLTQPTLGRHIAELERALGAPLFARGPRGLVLTDAGAAALPEARAMAQAEAAARRAVSHGEDRGRIRLTAAEVVAVEVLPPVLAAFRRAHPGILVDVAAVDRPEDLLRRAADLAVRMARPRQAALVVRRLGVAGLGLYARADAPLPLPLIGPEAAAALGGLVLDGRAVRPDDLALRSDAALVQLALARAGAGAAVFHHAVAARDPQLVRVHPGVEVRLEVWLAMHEDMRGNRLVRRLWDHLARSLPGVMRLGA